jgi:hypothetical protein
MSKLLGLALLMIAVALVIKSDGLFAPRLSPTEILNLQIVSDIKHSMQENGIAESNGIHHVKLQFRSHLAHQILAKQQPNFDTNPNGKIWLEIELLDIPDTKPPEFLTQTSVFDSKTNNKIAEFAHAYKIENQHTQIKK